MTRRICRISVLAKLIKRLRTPQKKAACQARVIGLAGSQMVERRERLGPHTERPVCKPQFKANPR